MANEPAEPGRPSDDRRLRATLVLCAAVLVEVGWLKFSVVPDFAQMYAELGSELALPWVTHQVLGWWPYLVAIALAAVAFNLGVRGAGRKGGMGTAAVVLAAVVLPCLGIFVIWALWAPVQALSPAISF